MPARPALAVAVAALVAACGGGGPVPSAPPGYAWQLPPGFPEPPVPVENPMSAAKVELGRRLFYDTRLSGNGTFSCGSCHFQALAFTDGRARSVGSTGQDHRRSSMSLGNVAYARSLTWANSVLTSLEAQAMAPMLGEDPVELGLSGLVDVMLARLEADPDYPALFRQAFPEQAAPVSLQGVVQAIASFERTLVTGDSPYDRHQRGDAAALPEPARRGLDLFRSDRLACSGCHSGFAFMDSVVGPGAPPELVFHNTGLYDEDGLGAYPPSDPGLAGLTGRAGDMGLFRVPSLRNVAVTAPYMHDGSIATLSEVLDHYAAGGRSALSRGGVPSPLRDPLVRGFTLTQAEKDDVVAFLESLTDATFLTDPRFSDPFAAP